MMDEATKMVRREYLRNEWVEDAKQIPFYDLRDENEEKVIRKCIEGEEFTETEIDLLEEVLGRYRDALEKYEPTETLENIERNEQLVRDEKQILSLMKQSHDEQKLVMKYPLSATETIDITLLVKNEINAEALNTLQENIGLFADLTHDELETFQKYAHNEPQSHEEIVIAQQIEQKIREKGQNNILKMRNVAITFLAKQTRIYDDPSSTEQGMKDIYEEMKLGYLLALFEKVQTMTGVSQIETETLFR